MSKRRLFGKRRRLDETGMKPLAVATAVQRGPDGQNDSAALFPG